MSNWSFGNVFRDAARAFPRGFELGFQADQNQYARELERLQVEQAKAELDSWTAAKQLDQADTQELSDNASAIQLTERLKSLAVLPPKERKIVLDAFARQLKSKYNREISPSAMEFLKSADSESIERHLEDTSFELFADPTKGQQAVVGVLTDDEKFMDNALKTMTTVAGERSDQEAQSEKAGTSGGELPDNSLLRKQRIEEMKSRAELSRNEKDIADLEAKINKMRGTVMPKHIEATNLWRRYQTALERRKELRGDVKEQEQQTFELEKGDLAETRSDENALRGEIWQRERSATEFGRQLGKEEGERSPIQVFPPNGQPFSVLTNGRGQFFDVATGQEVSLPSGARLSSSVLQGGASDIGITKTGAGVLEKNMITLSNARQRVQQMRAAFDPRFLTYVGQAGAGAINIARKAGMTVSPEMEEFARDYRVFARRVAENLNQTIQDITGAAMTQVEAPRIAKQIATLEDSPDNFLAVLDDVEQTIGNSETRLKMLRSKGFTDAEISEAMSKEGNPGGISLSKAEDYEKRRLELLSEVRAGKTTREAANKALNDEFGL